MCHVDAYIKKKSLDKNIPMLHIQKENSTYTIITIVVVVPHPISGTDLYTIIYIYIQISFCTSLQRDYSKLLKG